MANVPGRGAPPPRPDGPDRRGHGTLRSRGRAFQDHERELQAKLSECEAECLRLRHIISTGTEQYQRALQDLDGWRREALAWRTSNPDRPVPPASTGELSAPDGALVAAQAEIIRLTQRVAAAEAETVAAENRCTAINKTNDNTSRNYRTLSLELCKAKADLKAECRINELTKELRRPSLPAPFAPVRGGAEKS